MHHKRFEALRTEYGALARMVGDARPLSAELTFAQQPEWLAVDDPRIKRQVEEGEPGYGWTRWDEGGFLRLTWIAEQEQRRYGDAELATRDRPSAGTVKPRWQTGPNVRHKPHAGDMAPAPVPEPKAMRLDFGWDADEHPANDGR